MGNLVIDKINTEKKIDMIFTYLFSDNKAIEEEFFWNNLEKEEINKLQKIEKEEVYNFDNIKNLLWK